MEGEEPGYNVFNLLGAENRLATPGRRHALCWIHDAIRWHQGLRVDAARIVDPQAQRRRIQPAADSREWRRKIALLIGVADRCTVAQEAKPPLSVGCQRAAAGRIAGMHTGPTLEPYLGNRLLRSGFLRWRMVCGSASCKNRLRSTLAGRGILGESARGCRVENQGNKADARGAKADTGRGHDCR